MRRPTGTQSLVLASILFATAAAATLIAANGSRAQAQTPLAPCVCSRSTPIVGADEITAVPGQLSPRYGIVHCQCGAATCVSQVAYGSVGLPQLFCVK